MTNYCEVDLTPLKESESGKAWLCDVGLEEPIWLPASQFETPPDKDDLDRMACFELTNFICREKGLI